MPIAVIIDIIKSRDMENHKRKYILEIIYNIISELEKVDSSEIKESLIALPAITGGDSLEILSENSKSVLYILLRLLMHEVPIRIGIGTGKVDIIRATADECDGPAYWAARKALEEGRKKKTIILVYSHESSERWEYSEAKFIASVFLLLSRMTLEQRKYCFHYVWENMRVKEIAEKENVSASNISQIIKKANCKSLKHLIMS